MIRVTIDLVVSPHTRIGAIHTGDNHAMAGNIRIPTGPLPILDGEELFINRSAQDVTLARCVHGIEHIGTLAGDGFGISPPQSITLIESVARRTTTIIVIAATSHNVPSIGMVALAATTSVVGIIKVGQTQHMAELVAHGTDALDGNCRWCVFPSIQLG